MGRRAKNKQAAPEPLPLSGDKPAHRSGKRKADSNEKRPTKKLKNTPSVGSLKGKAKKSLPSTKAGSKNKPKNVQESDDIEGASSSGGWEDVDDDADLQDESA